MTRVQVQFEGTSRGAVGAAKQTAASIAQVRKEAQLAEHDLGKLSRGALAGSGVFRGLGRSVAFASAGFLGGYGLTAAVAGAFGEMEKGLESQAQTRAALKSTGAVAGITAKQVRDLAHAESEKVGVDDDLIQAAENLLLTFRFVRNEAGKGNDIFTQATRVTEDLSRAMGIDLNSAALQVGKALNDPERGMNRLQRIGVTFTNQQKEQVKQLLKTGDVLGAQKVILRELNLEFGKSAEAYGRTLPGTISSARETLRNFSAEMLIGLTPSIQKGTDALKAWLEDTDNQARVQRAANTVIRDGTEIVKGIVGAVRTVAPIVKDAVDSIGGWKNAFALLLGLKVASVFGGWTKAITGEQGLLPALRHLDRKWTVRIGFAVIGGEILAELQRKLDKLTGATAAEQALVQLGKGVRYDPTSGRYIPQGGTAAGGLYFTQAQAAKAAGISIAALQRLVQQGTRAPLQPQPLSGPAVQIPTSFRATHETAGLPGFPAVDIMAKPGTPIRAPEDGMITRISGQPPSKPPPLGQGGPWGLSIYYVGTQTGNTYYMTHLMKVAQPGSYRKGDVIGLIGDYPGSSADHVHVGIHKGDSSEAHAGSTLINPSDYVRVAAPKSGGFTPQDPNAFKTPAKKARKSAAPAADALPGGLRLQLATATATSGLADDITANQAAIDFLTGKLNRTTNKGVRADLVTAITGYRQAIKDARGKLRDAAQAAATKANELPGGLRLRIAAAAATSGLQDDISANEAAVAYLTGRLKKTTDKGVRADLVDSINGYRQAIKDARTKLKDIAKAAADAARAATGRRTEEGGIVAQFQAAIGATGEAFQFDLLPASQEAKLRGQIAKFAALTKKVEADAKITPGELARVKASWSALSQGLAAAAGAVADHTRQVFDTEWAGITGSLTRGITESWSIAQRDFGRETDAGLREISSRASRDLQQMQRDFQRQLDQFDRDTQAGLRALAAPDETPTEAILRQRSDARAAQDLQDRLAADQAAGDAKAVAQDLYDIETARLEQQAKAERQAADSQAQAAQDAYQQQRDQLRQALVDQESEREAARQASADAEAQAYQDRRDAQWQHLQDMHDDQVAAFSADLAQWGTWIANKQKTYADFLQWLANNPISKGLSGQGPGQFTPTGQASFTSFVDALGRTGDKFVTGFASGGRIPGAYLGVDDTVMARVTPGETVIDRSLTQKLAQALQDGRVGGGGPMVAEFKINERVMARAIVRQMSAELDRRISYRLET